MNTSRQTSKFRAFLITVLVLLLAFTIAYRVNGQETDSRIKERLNANTAAAIVAIIDSARSSGIPSEPLVQKALQGAARGAEDQRITAAVRRLASDMSLVRGVLGARTSVAELEAGASALRAGIKGTVLSDLRKTRPQQPLVVALATLSDLVARGVPTDAAAAAVTSLVARGATDAEILNLQRDVDKDIKAGLSPASAAAVRSRPVSTAPVTRTSTRPSATTPTRPNAPTTPTDGGDAGTTTRTGTRRGG